jgi:hypothetical protein
MWCYRHGDSSGFTFLHFAPNGYQKDTAVSAVSTQQYISTRPHGVTSEKILIFMFTVARTLNFPEILVPVEGGGALMRSEDQQNSRKNKRNDFLHLTHFKLLLQVEWNSIKYCELFEKFVIFVRGENFVSSNGGPKSLVTPLVPATVLHGVASQKPK